MNFKKIIFFCVLAVNAFLYTSPKQLAGNKLPIFFHPSYDIGFFGLENLHPFDAKKYGKVKKYLQNILHLTAAAFYRPERISDDALKKVMTQAYLDSLHSSSTVAQITELPPLAWLPNFLVRRYLLDPMRYATDGTIKATQLALSPDNTRHYAINLSGGYHHAMGTEGGGFCIYPDIPLACRKVWETNPKLKILYVDLDAHQGNGVERTLEKEMDEGTFVVFDLYGGDNYPYDPASLKIRQKIQYNYPVEVRGLISPTDASYLAIVRDNLPRAIAEAKPDLIFYNAGTDVYKDDRLGGMFLTKEGIKQRDAFVFQQAKDNNIPIVMTLSGGYSPESAQIIGESIHNIVTNVMGNQEPVVEKN
jgi:histone deacetylase 11